MPFMESFENEGIHEPLCSSYDPCHVTSVRTGGIAMNRHGEVWPALGELGGLPVCAAYRGVARAVTH